MFEIFLLFLAGAFGALVKDVVVDGKLELPKKEDGYIILGFLASVLIGGFVGWAIDGSYLTAGMAGFVGLSAIQNLLLKKTD